MQESIREKEIQPKMWFVAMLETQVFKIEHESNAPPCMDIGCL